MDVLFFAWGHKMEVSRGGSPPSIPRSKQTAVRYGTPLGVEHDHREYPVSLYQIKAPAAAGAFLFPEKL